METDRAIRYATFCGMLLLSVLSVAGIVAGLSMFLMAVLLGGDFLVTFVAGLVVIICTLLGGICYEWFTEPVSE